MNKKERSRLLNKAKAFDLCLEVAEPAFEALVEEIYEELRTSGHFSKKINYPNQKRDLGAILANLLKAEQSGWNPYQRISLRPVHYKLNRYNPLEISFRGTRRAFEGLLTEGYIKKVSGFRKPSTGLTKETRFRSRPKLSATFDRYKAKDFEIRQCAKGETILLRDDKKQLIDYAETADTIRWRDNLGLINDVLEGAWVDLYVPDTELERINDILERDKEKQPIDFSRKRLVRIFNNSAWDQGGRFYRGWWQEIPSEYRHYVHINDKMTVEVDFSGMHPQMLYLKYTGKDYPGDPYGMSYPREVAKRLFNILINSEDEPKGRGAIRDELKAAGLPSDRTAVDAVIHELMTKHAPIKMAFFSGEGVKLQFLDSQIAEQVMMHFLKERYPVLPVHDSFLIHQGLRDELDEAMKKAFKTVLGSVPKTKMGMTFKEKEEKEKPHSDNLEDYLVTSDIHELLKDRQTHSYYYERGKKYGWH